MSERTTPHLDPETLLHLKGNVLENWHQLPAEHQASMVLMMYSQMMSGEYGSWLRSAVKLMNPREGMGPFRFLPVVEISPEHLAQASLTQAEIAELNTEDLHYISHEIVRHYTNDVFWEELEFIARKALEEKRQIGSQEDDGVV